MLALDDSDEMGSPVIIDVRCDKSMGGTGDETSFGPLGEAWISPVILHELDFWKMKRKILTTEREAIIEG